MGSLSVKLLEDHNLKREEIYVAINDLIDHSTNGTLFHRPQFLDYHSESKRLENKVEYKHFCFYRRSRLIGYLPGALATTDQGMHYLSPWGASVGGLVLHPSAVYSEIESMVGEWMTKIKSWGVQQIKVTLVPSCFQRLASQDTVEFELLKNGFVHADYTLLMSVCVEDLAEPLEGNFHEVARRLIRQSIKRGCTVCLSDDYDSFWQLLVNTQERHGALPTHSRTELQSLLKTFPEAFVLFLARVKEKPIGAMLLFQVSENASTAFYICSDSAYWQYRPVNLLSMHVLNWAKEKKLKWLDYGPGSFGKDPHTSLIRFKERHAGKGIGRRQLIWRDHG